MNMEHWWNDNDMAELKYWVKKHVPVLVCLPQILHWLASDWSHSMAYCLIWIACFHYKLLHVNKTGTYGKVKVILQQAWTGPRGSRSVKAPDFLDVRHYKDGRLSGISTGRLYPRRNPWYSFSEAESTPGARGSITATEKIHSDTTGNRSWDRPTSSAVP